MDTPWRIELLGWLRAVHGDLIVSRFYTHKHGALLAYLAYHSDRSHPRELLIELLWPEADPRAGRNRLKVALTSLRRQLEPPGIPAGAVILADRATVQLNPTAVTTDVAEFEAGVRTGLMPAGSAVRVQQLIEALALYRGELLPGYFEDWIVPERQRLAEVYLQALEQLADLMEKGGDLPGALQWARRAVSADPLREEGRRDLMRLLAASGERNAALQQYEELERLLARELRIEPDAETRALSRAIERAEVRPRRPDTEPGQLDADAAGGRLSFGGSPGTSPRIPSPLGEPLPTGTVTFLLVEIIAGVAPGKCGEVGGTELMEASLEECHERLRPLFRGYGGHEIPTSGKRLQMAFGRASDAVAAAIAAQRSGAENRHRSVECSDVTPHPASREAGDPSTQPVQLRMALHTDEVEPGEEAFGSPAYRHAARLLLAAHPEQILLSEGTAVLLRGDPSRSLRLLDLGLYRLQHGAAPERLFAARDLELSSRDEPPPDAQPVVAGNLPLQFTRFFGREEEIAGLQALLLDPEIRLVTLTGPGGSGKTRLALEAAGRLAPRFHGAVWVVSLADLSDPRLIPDQILDALHLPRSPQGEPLEQVAAFLSRQSVLLVLDNFEQLVKGAPIVHTLLERAPTLTCLVTSRQRLDLPSEREFPVPPLPVPGVQAFRCSGVQDEVQRTPEHLNARTPEHLIQYPSVQLFIHRAQGVRPDFQVTAANAAVVAALCARLEGLPLAIELAAARAGVLTPQQMLARLEQRFELLVRRGRPSDPRHRSLRAALDWSYQLLSAELQRFFARLSVFRGGWTLEAAEAVCEEPYAFDYLEQLRDCSLVLTEVDGGEMRHRMLETLREFGAEHLGPEELAALERRRAEYYLALAERAQPELSGPDQGIWLDRLEREHGNFRAALDWAVSSGSGGASGKGAGQSSAVEEVPGRTSAAGEPVSVELGLRLAAALFLFWKLRAHWQEGRVRLAGLLALAGARARTVTRARGLRVAAHLTDLHGHFEEARAQYEESLAIYREQDDKPGIAAALDCLGHVAFEQGDYATAQTLCAESLAIYRELGEKSGIASSLRGLAIVALWQGDFDGARGLYEQGLAMGRELEDRAFIATCLNQLGDLNLREGNHEAARQCYEEAVIIRRELADQHGIASSLERLSSVALCQDDEEGARALSEAGLAIRRELGNNDSIAWSLSSLGMIARRQGDVERAASLNQEGLILFRDLKNIWGIAECLEGLASVAVEATGMGQGRGRGPGHRAPAPAGPHASRVMCQARFAARLFGAADALVGAIRPARPPADRADYERLAAAARAALGEEAFAAAWAEGHAMPLEHAIAEALRNLEGPNQA